MFDTYKIFSKTGCPYCTKVIQVLQLAELPFVEYKLGRDFTRAEFYEEFGPGSTFPRVKLEEELIGGCTETVKYLKENDLV
jgi:glutaredoxin